MEFHAFSVRLRSQTHGKMHEISVAGNSVLEFHISSVRLRSKTHGKAHEIPVAGKQ